jgi:hypothetical protein
MRTVAIFGEGRDDVAAIRALLRELGFRSEDRRTTTFAPSEGSRQLRFRRDDALVLLQGVQGKSRLAADALLTIQGAATERPETLIVCFDPDGTMAADHFSFFTREVAGLSPAEGGAYHHTVGARVVRIIPAPWHRADAAAFASLPDEHNLERILIGGVLASAEGARLRGWAEEATTDLMSLVQRHGWKRAFRMWCAAVFPDSEAFVDRLLQDEATRAVCLTALQATPVWKALQSALPRVTP